MRDVLLLVSGITQRGAAAGREGGDPGPELTGRDWAPGPQARSGSSDSGLETPLLAGGG